VDALDDADTIDHATRAAVPLRQDQHVPLAELVNGLLELRTPAGGLA